MAPVPASVPRPGADAHETQFRAIFASEFQYVWNALRRFGVPERDLEDVTHDVFLRVYRQMGRYDAERPVRPWLFAFAFRTASDYRRLARNRVEKLEHGKEDEDPAPAADERLARAETLSAGQSALETLEEGQRAVFILYELDGYSMQEIATALGIPVNTAYSRLRLARERFQATIARLNKPRGGR